MILTQDPTVREIAANSLAAVRVFERLGIDYCCGGNHPLAEVCQQMGLNVAVVREELDAAILGTPSADRDWSTAPLPELIRHIVDTHHAYLRREMPAIETRLEKVYRVYNQRYGPTLTGLPQVFEALRAELESHLLKEERILFPAIVRNETAVAGPIRMMEFEHDNAGQALAKIREITNNFEIPGYACVTYRALMSGLAEMEQDLHMHIHLENNILFPRAQANSGTGYQIAK
jgi:regulator of cell morphogenesis and NO signaling